MPVNNELRIKVPDNTPQVSIEFNGVTIDLYNFRNTRTNRRGVVVAPEIGMAQILREGEVPLAKANDMLVTVKRE